MAHASARSSAPSAIPVAPLPAADADVGVDASQEHAQSKAGDAAPELTHPIVAYHLFALAVLVYAIVVVGGLTRLTESGLSITEWNPGFKGMRLPSTDAEWHAEWDKYKLTPEFLLLNQRMSLEDFKSIYMWEWAHRVLGRVIGAAFILPAAYFLARPGWVARGTRWKLLAIGAGIGFQGALGWFMVKSGLSDPTKQHASPQAQALAQSGQGVGFPPIPSAVHDGSDLHSTASTSDWTPRVSHFRLAAHLGTAFLVYLGMLHTGLSILRDWKLAKGAGTVAGVPLQPASTAVATEVQPRQRVVAALNHPLVRKYARTVRNLSIFVFCTAMSGALVAGLDAGLIYNEWPTMGGDGRLAPPAAELMDTRYGLRSTEGGAPSTPASSGWKLWVGNTFNNPATVQLVHRTLATTSFVAVLALAWKTRSLRRALAATSSPGASAGVKLPPRIPQLAALACGAVTLQASLGITTLLYLVPIPLASAHQAGSLALLSVLIALSAALRRPGAALVRVLESGSGSGSTNAWRDQVRRKALARVAVQSR
ncbi:Cytochrome c oxidase assembly protein cox15 [Tilletia horrida]|uniref:Cytochrome c oxidase assembly protein cox15 n=1 Tax=Tilletia horrida TaxID=155126 RepID=A0AAN6GAN8_9BASI|nr:Cytochrome c oxidase assembly protein cox15 [Tilletia horrida]KAK0523851.1 Cytochrome c oxidase assembly protein cox15 [Tilletia horrida]KAK0526341.1 Cytochrome c oxidase assembly protein cox15 [Tilletia horrida]